MSHSEAPDAPAPRPRADAAAVRTAPTSVPPAPRLRPGPRRTLAAIADTLLPAGPGLPSATELGSVEAVETMLAAGDPRDRAALQVALTVWEHLLAGRPGAPFSAASGEQRERRTRELLESRVPPLMQLAQGVRSLTMIAAHSVSGPGGVNPRVGSPPHALDAPPMGVPLRKRSRLSCDVVVIGSGAGGGTAAGVLAAGGLDVVVLEEGEALEAHHGAESEFDRTQRTYRNGGAQIAAGDGTIIQTARCVGGGTALNYTASYDLPAFARERWLHLGLEETFGGGWDVSEQAVRARLSLTTRHSCVTPRDEAVGAGFERLGWKHYATDRNVTDCVDDLCAKCSFGCPRGAKQDQAHTFLRDAVASGAQVFSHARVERVVTTGGRASGVQALDADGERVDVSCRAVICAAGAINSPALLRRSGLDHPHLGKHLRLQPATFIAGLFDEPMGPMRGSLVGWTSEEFADLDGLHNGVKFATSASNLPVFAALMPWESSARHAELIGRFEHVASTTMFLREEAEGRVTVSRGGRSRVAHKLTGADRQRLLIGVRRGAELMAASGAQEVVSAHRRPVRWRPHDGSAALERALEAAGSGSGSVALASVHPVGTLRMAANAQDGCVDPHGRWWGVDGLHVLDGSALPGSPGAAPMLTIATLAHRRATVLAGELR